MGVSLEAFRTLDAEGTLAETLDPYGWGDFDQLRVRGAVQVSALPEDPGETGVQVALAGAYLPTSLDVEEGAGSLSAYAAGRLVGRGYFQPTLALRAGAEKVWGAFPLHEAAYVGGEATLRGFRNERFAGDASLFAGSELRLFLADVVFLLPGELGVLGLADVGRVFGAGEPSDRWHSAGGGGLWIRWVDAYTLSLAVARGNELTGLYLALGFPF